MDLRQYLKDTILLFDGAMGTYYADKLNSSFEACEMANLNNPDIIYSIHREYIAAGAKAIKTNTFSANPYSLSKPMEVVKDIIAKGYEIALKAAENNVFVFADIGPVPAPGGLDVSHIYFEIIDTFLESGAENFIFETFPSADHVTEAAKYIKNKNPHAFILAEFAVNPEGFTRKGISGKKMFYELSLDKNLDALGFNCVSGPKHLLEFSKELDFHDKTISIMPNAGYPTVINSRTFFEGGAVYFSEQMASLAKLGVSILGGCCGTDPEFIKQTHNKLINIKKHIPSKPSEKNKNIANTSFSHKLLEKIEKGRKIIVVELDPPLDTNIEFFMESAKKLKSVEIDAITIADCPIARARVDSSLLACKIKRELKVEAIPHLTCRDRNINATKALLLGLSIERIENVLVVTGDPIPSAQRDEVKSMFSFNSSNLAAYISSLNETVFESPFLISAALNVNSKNFDSQLKHAQNKIKNGVSMFLTQPVFTKEAFENLKRAKNTLNAKILGGIMPIVSYRNACFMNNEISGIDIPENIVDLYEGISKDEALKLAVSLSLETAEKISSFVDGYYLMTPLNKIDIICAIASEIKA